MTRFRFFPILTILFGLFAFYSCKSEDKSNAANENLTFLNEFVEQFKEGLSAEEDRKLLGMLKLERSQEALTELVKVLKNTHHSIKCEFDFGRTTFQKIGENQLQVWFPVSLVNTNYPNQEPEIFIVSAKVEKLDNSFVIREMDADLLYHKFTAFENRDFWKLELEAEYEKRKLVYELVERLQAGVDSVIWFTRYQDQLYFYFVQGEWDNPKSFDNYRADAEKTVPKVGSYKMGLLNAEGKVVIPADYDLIGTLGFDMENLVEVKRNGKYGMYHLQSRLPVIPAVYDVLIPFTTTDDKKLILTQEGKQTGYFNSDFLRFEGLPPVQQIDEYLAGYKYLDKGLLIKNGQQAMMEVPNKEYLGNGYVVPPSYLSNLQVMDSIEFGFTTTELGFNAGNESREFLGLSWQKISDTFNGLIVLIKDRYMDGREEFYYRSRVAILDKENTVKANADFNGSDLVSIRFLRDFGYYEAKTNHYEYLIDVDVDQINLHNFSYFKLSENGEIKYLETRRVFPETKFSKMDSSYVRGDFSLFVGNGEYENSDFLSEKTIQFMLDGILADNGYVFPDEDREMFFSYYRKEGDKTTGKIEEAMANFSEIDRHNYDFLSSLLPKKAIASR
ncbi:hypothetical protein C943_01643 [Mariniradius saccharolyticus AK6]|uniref:YARHG domain-containing protein n=1 Tax=Mariniradius saccharolyticus AK6 TaxID=1239962 RepID=M7XBF1_9BACT|nr:WG repeat-containing protein [Mariniradius saccharolyticus]EMS31908.1 hypothetical protein C943_01643 [Mariniradius saccharolyticus AK6]